MRILIQSDDGTIQREVVRPEEFDFKDPCSSASLMNEIRDYALSVKTEEAKDNERRARKKNG